MFYHDGKLQYRVRVETPNPVFAKLLQQAIGGIEGEMRVALQYLFQAWNSRGPKQYREMLLETGTEELAHIEMLATAVALNLEGADGALKEQMAKENPAVGAVLGGMDPRHFLSGGLGAMAADANGVPFNGSWVVSSGNLAADMYANVMAESTGRALATRLYEFTDDPGMKDMLAFLIARDTMHQQQWLAVLEELGGHQGALPIPNSFPQERENGEFNYVFLSTKVDGTSQAQGRWSRGPSLDGKSEYSIRQAQPQGGEPQLAPPVPQAHAQKEQMGLAAATALVRRGAYQVGSKVRGTGGGKLLALSLLGASLLGVGGYVLYRNVSGQGRGKHLRVERRVFVNRPPEELYRFWRRLENLPQVMSHLESVTDLGGGQSHWVAKAPAGRRVSWDAEVTEDRENERIAWRSLEGATVPNWGSVLFRASPEGRATEVRVVLAYEPPAGRLGAAVARLFGEEPARQLDDDLRRFKERVEASETAATGEVRSGRD